MNLLVAGEYEALERLTDGRFVAARQLERLVRQFGYTLTTPPARVWDDIDAVQAEDKAPATFHVVFPLWTSEEGESDLTLELRLVEAYPDALETEIVDLRVL